MAGFGSPRPSHRRGSHSREVGLMRSGGAQSDHLPAPGTIAGDPRKPSIADFDAHNPYWSFPGIYIESTRSWRSISVDVISRTVGTVMWQSDHHRVAVALTAHAGVAYVDGGSAQTARFSPGEVSFTPAGVSIRTIFPAVRSYIPCRARRPTTPSVPNSCEAGRSISRCDILLTTRWSPRSYGRSRAKQIDILSTISSLMR